MKWENKKRKQKLFSSQNCKVFLVHSTSGKKYDEVKIWPLNESFTSKRTRWKSFSWFMCCNIQTFYCKMIHVDLKQTFCSPDSMNYSMTIPHSREPIDAIKKRWAIFLTIISIAMTTCNFRYRPKLHQLLYSIEIVASSRWGCVIKGGQSNEIWDFFTPNGSLRMPCHRSEHVIAIILRKLQIPDIIMGRWKLL